MIFYQLLYTLDFHCSFHIFSVISSIDFNDCEDYFIIKYVVLHTAMVESQAGASTLYQAMQRSRLAAESCETASEDQKPSCCCTTILCQGVVGKAICQKDKSISTHNTGKALYYNIYPHDVYLENIPHHCCGRKNVGYQFTHLRLVVGICLVGSVVSS